MQISGCVLHSLPKQMLKLNKTVTSVSSTAFVQSNQHEMKVPWIGFKSALSGTVQAVCIEFSPSKASKRHSRTRQSDPKEQIMVCNPVN